MGKKDDKKNKKDDKKGTKRTPSEDSCSNLSGSQLDFCKRKKRENAEKQKSRDNSKKREDDDKQQKSKCKTIGSSKVNDACSDEKFLESMLPLLQNLRDKQNLSARITIQKVLYDALDEEVVEASSEPSMCCREVPARKKSTSPSHGQRRNS